MNAEADIRSVLDECTRTYFQKHGGSVVLESVQDGVAYVRLCGACAGCPTAELDVKEYVQAKLCQSVHSITRVEMTRVIDPELLAMARRLLDHEAQQEPYYSQAGDHVGS